MRPGQAIRVALGLFVVASLGLGCDSDSATKTEKPVQEQPSSQGPEGSSKQKAAKAKATRNPEELRKRMPSL
jgi:hypothetical protein